MADRSLESTAGSAINETLARRAQDTERAPAASRAAHVASLREEGKLSFDTAEGSWWTRFTAADASEILRRNDHRLAREIREREAQQQQSQDEELI